jgi:hypothetical protein
MLCKSSLLLAVAALGLGLSSARLPSYEPEEVVNILGGTDSRFEFSTGATLPLIARSVSAKIRKQFNGVIFAFLCRPWGFNHWAPMSDHVSSDDFGFWFHPYDRRFFGMRCTHQPSPWINDYGQVCLHGSVK